jgi:hypothetical protein
MSDFLKALLITSIPIVVLSLITVPGRDYSQVAIWFLATILWLVAITSSILFAVKGKRQIAAGTLAGAGIGAIALGVTYFALVQDFG